jgi:hypothetical protein
MTSSTRRLLPLVLAVLAFCSPAFAKFSVRPGWVKSYVNSSNPTALAQLVAAADSELLYIYTTETRAVVYTPSLSTLSAKAAQMGMRAIAAKDISDLATVGPLVFDPRDVVPQPEDFRSYRSNDQGLYVLHFAVNPDQGYVPQLDALGIKVVAQGSVNTAVVMATPLQIVNADPLPWVAYRDFLQPWMKQDAAIDPERYYSALVTVAPGAPNADRIAFEASQPAFASSPDGSCYLGADLAPILANPLVLSVRVRPSLVDISGVLPGQAPVGSQIYVNSLRSFDIDELRFNGIRATFSRPDHLRLLVTVPSGLTAGPVDILALRADGWRQILPAGVDYGFHVAEAYGRTLFSTGDVLTVSETPILILPPGPLYALQWWTPQGELRRERDETPLGPLLFFGAQGFLNATSFGAPLRYDARLDAAGEGPSILKDVTAMTMARDGTSFLVAGSELRRHAPGGALQDKTTLPEVNSVDVDVDQCTLLVGALDGLSLFDGCRMAPLVTLRTGEWIAARFLPDGTLLASNTADSFVYRLSRAGAVLARTAMPGNNTTIALSPDGFLAWLASAGHVYRYDVLTNQRSEGFDAGERDLRNIAVYGGWSAGRGAATYDDPIVIESVRAFDVRPGDEVTITGRGFIAGAQVTIGGLAVASPNVGETRITFTMPAGIKTSRELVIVNPNGERGSYVARQGKRRAV